MWKLIKFIVWLSGFAAMLLVMAGFFSHFHPAFDAVANLRWHLAVGLLLLALLALMSLRYRFCLFAVVIGVFGILATVPLYNPVHEKAKGEELSLLSFNLLFDNPKKQETIDMLVKRDADVMNLMESSPQWSPYLAQLEEIWPYQLFCSSYNRVGGVTIFSKRPLIKGVSYCKDDGSLAIAAINFDSEDIVIGAVHLSWPWPWNNSEQIDGMKEILQQLPDNAILAGDFNSASWTDNLLRFASYGNLIHDRTIAGSWILKGVPAKLARFVGLRIDQVLHKGNLTLKDLQILDPSGSDHLPVFARFVISPQVENNAIPQKRPEQ